MMPIATKRLSGLGSLAGMLPPGPTLPTGLMSPLSPMDTLSPFSNRSACCSEASEEGQDMTESSSSSTPSSVDDTQDTLVLSYESHGYHFSIPSNLRSLGVDLRDQYLRDISLAKDQTLAHTQRLPASRVELVAGFLGFATKELPAWKTASQESRDQLLESLISSFKKDFLRRKDIHVLAKEASSDHQIQLDIIESYFTACAVSRTPDTPIKSALISSALSGKSKIYAILGGQGITQRYLEELRELFTTYNHHVASFITSLSNALENLASNIEVCKLYSEGLSVLKWLREPDTAPDVEYLTSAPVSFPIIGLLQLTHYWVALKVLGISPAQFNESLSGLAGHSQGIVVAATIANADTWSSLLELSCTAVEILFWIGARSQQGYPTASLDPAVVHDSIENGEGKPTSMLSVKGAPQSQVQKHIDAINKYLSKDETISISLFNGPRNFIISGPPLSLYGLNVRLRQYKAPLDADQTKISFRERKLPIRNQFLQITAPFHSKYLAAAFEVVRKDLKHIEIQSDNLRVPVYDTWNGDDISSFLGENIVQRLAGLIMIHPVHWEHATTFDGASHIVDFGPGESSSIGAMTSQNKAGTGVRVILACSVTGLSNDIGYRAELFNQDESSVVSNKSWAELYSPSLSKTKTGAVFVNTKMSRLLGLPPIMVAGMTPTTAAWKFVSATINAGYHIEFAGGGHHNERSMTSALTELVASTPSGRGITVNLIYANARAMKWQVALLAKLRNTGMPIDGLAIGAGVPSAEVLQGYIKDLGLKQISLKPGSSRAIEATIAVAKANPTFPIILEWTGGRAGGHHSFEDFHAPVLDLYNRIRDCGNIILVAGSGFASSSDIYPYITGSWSRAYGYPPMPFDGVLFGSRMMTAKEAQTSTEAKKSIVAATGLPDDKWDLTYKGPAGGIITVISEMGEPIHMIATRGVKLWAEMDVIFKMDKAKRLQELQKKRSYIIKKLNADFQRVWFGRNRTGETVELKDMTYHEVLLRMVDLMYIKSECRWIDKTLMTLTGDFIRRVEERFVESSNEFPLLPDMNELGLHPYTIVDKVIERYPETQEQLITALDANYFLQICLRPGQKPVPFIPVIDENFETFFKKDSLWQSEDIAAIPDGDIGRTCILQGPVAVGRTNTFDEPVKVILDGFMHDLVTGLSEDLYQNNERHIPVVEYFGDVPKPVDSSLFKETVAVSLSSDSIVYEISTSTNVEMPSERSWFELLMGAQHTWRRALLSSEFIPSNSRMLRGNPIRRMCAPRPGLSVAFQHYTDVSKLVIIVKEQQVNDSITKLEIKLLSSNQIQATMFFCPAPGIEPVQLALQFKYQPDAAYAPILEIVDSRVPDVSSFYKHLWIGDTEFNNEAYTCDDLISKTFSGETTTITAEAISAFTQAIGNHNKQYTGQYAIAPLDFGIVLGWKSLVKPVLLPAIGGDILNLVHLTNSFTMAPGATLLSVGDEVTSLSQITAISIQDSGKVVQVEASIAKAGKTVLKVVSEFMYRGAFTDYHTTFQRKLEKPIQVRLDAEKNVSILQSKEWFVLDSQGTDLLGKTLIFYPEVVLRFKDKTVFSSVQVSGRIDMKTSETTSERVGSIVYGTGMSHGNPVQHYLQKHGVPVEGAISLATEIPIHSSSFKTPNSGSPYSHASGDTNPIHVSSTFAALAQLPAVIHHGMYTSGAVRSLLEGCMVQNDPSRMRSFKTSFVGMVFPGDEIEVDFHHTGMVDGCKVVKFQAKKTTGEAVLLGEAEVDQLRSAYLFTGQGSQEKNMGMELYATSAVARSVWDRADAYYLEKFGFAITDIVKNNPKELTIHFGGVRGRRIRKNYMDMCIQGTDDNGNVVSKRLFDTINENSQSYTYRAPEGLLFATQFTQPALTLLEVAQLRDMESKGLISPTCSYAGHSLGEFPALAAFANIMTIEQLIAVVFFRGLAMQVAVKRDDAGASNYSMCAVNPSRVARHFSERALVYLVARIVDHTGMLLEIVNHNISDRQYVCAGELRALDCLASTLAYTTAHPEISFSWLSLPPATASADEDAFLAAIHPLIATAISKPNPIRLNRGLGFVPLAGIDVPFHSTLLRPGVDSFRSFLRQQISKDNTRPDTLVGRWIPNLVGRPFSLEREYFERVFEITKSVAIEDILLSWEGVRG